MVSFLEAVWRVLMPHWSAEDKSAYLMQQSTSERSTMNWDDELPKPKRQLVLGEDLERFALAELAERIVALEAEIKRTQAEIAAKQKHKAAAEKLFGG